MSVGFLYVRFTGYVGRKALEGLRKLGKCYGLHSYRSLGVLRRQPVTDVSSIVRNETLASISGGRTQITGNV